MTITQSNCHARIATLEMQPVGAFDVSHHQTFAAQYRPLFSFRLKGFTKSCHSGSSCTAIGSWRCCLTWTTVPCWHSARDNDFRVSVHKTSVGSSEQALCCNSLSNMQGATIDYIIYNTENNDIVVSSETKGSRSLYCAG